MSEPLYTKTCPYCGEEIMASAIKCKHCGEWLDGYNPNATAYREPPTPEYQPMSQPMPTRSNGFASAGLVLSIIGLCLCWFPIIGWSLLLVGLVFSIIGVNFSPKGKAIAGLIISGVGIMLAVFVVAAVPDLLDEIL